MIRRIGIKEIEEIALGAAVLGTGGGGDPYLGYLMAREVMRKHGPVQLVSADELADDALVVVTAGIGAPTVGVEKLESGDELIAAFRQLERYLDRKVDAVLSVEAGGFNSIAPFLVAGSLGLPVVDGDGMGRAFPEVQMVTFTLYGIMASPFALADEKGNVCIFEAIDNKWTERLARSATIEMGCTAQCASFAMSGAQARQAVVPGTISLCQRIGQAIRSARGTAGVDAVLELTGGFRLFCGKVADVSRQTVTGFARGEATLEGVDAYQGQALRLQFQNEHLVAQTGDRILCSAPDLICVFDVESGEPVTTEALRYGYRVEVIGIPCDPRFRSPEGLKLVGPRYFGYDFDYIPVEERLFAG